MLNKAELYLNYLLSLNTCESSMCHHLSIELQSNEKLYTFPFKDDCLASVALLDILPRKNCIGKLRFLLSASNLKISFPLTNK